MKFLQFKQWQVEDCRMEMYTGEMQKERPERNGEGWAKTNHLRFLIKRVRPILFRLDSLYKCISILINDIKKVWLALWCWVASWPEKTNGEDNTFCETIQTDFNLELSNFASMFSCIQCKFFYGYDVLTVGRKRLIDFQKMC